MMLYLRQFWLKSQLLLIADVIGHGWASQLAKASNHRPIGGLSDKATVIWAALWIDAHTGLEDDDDEEEAQLKTLLQKGEGDREFGRSALWYLAGENQSRIIINKCVFQNWWH